MLRVVRKSMANGVVALVELSLRLHQFTWRCFDGIFQRVSHGKEGARLMYSNSRRGLTVRVLVLVATENIAMITHDYFSWAACR